MRLNSHKPNNKLPENSEKWNLLNKSVVQFEKQPTQLRLDKLDWADSSQWGRAAYHILLGIIRNRTLINDLIQKHASKKPKPQLHAYLSIGISQILQTDQKDRHPKIVHHTVTLVNQNCSKGEGRFANAILRKIASTTNEHLESLEKQKKWHIRYSHPQWLIDRWISSFGEPNTIKLLQWNQKTPKTYIHDYTRFLNKPENKNLINELSLKESKWDDFYELERASNDTIQKVIQYPLYIQDPATAVCTSLATESIKGTVLDACAAPGGKTLMLLKRMQNKQGKIYAVDRKSNRLRMISENYDRLNLNNIQIIEHDWETNLENDSLPQWLDYALVDAPCTSTGIMAKHPEIRWRLKENDFKQIPEAQLKIMQSVSQKIKLGGKLVYSTCSIDPDENSLLGKRFLETECGSKFDWLTARLCLPHLHGHDGAGVILFQRIK